MRASEFIRENVEHFNGLDFSIEIEKDDEYVDDDDTDNQTIYVKAFANGRELGHVLFTIDYDGQGMILKPQDLEVEERYQGQGIARTMYDYVKSKGYRIRRSGQQTDAGAGFWNKHRPEQNVWEAFDQPYPHEIEQKSEFGDYDTLVRLPDGNYLTIMFNHEGNDEWQVEFYRNNSQEVTGEGDAQRIFATVLNAIQKFIKEHEPWRLFFSAKKNVEPGQNSESRAKLYSRLVNRYAAAWGYDDYSEDHGDQVVYELTRLKRSVAEGIPQPGKSVTDAIQKVMPMAQEIWFHGSRATGKHRRNSDTDILVVIPDDIIGDQYLAVVRTLQKLSSLFDNYDIQPTKSGTNIHRIAQEEGKLLWSNRQGIAEGSDNLNYKKQNEDAELEEMAGKIHAGVRKILQDKGYEYLGSGIDKQAYLEPGTGQVLIVFGYRKGVDDFSPDQRMFINWINYCNKNRQNPHLPKFSGFESFQFQGKNYIQARMEALQEVSEEVGYLVGNIDEVTMQVGRGDFDNAIETLASYAQDSSYEGDAAVWYDIKTAIRLLGGKKQAKNILDTVHTVKKFGKKHGFSIDLHRGNFMARPNGTIVVNDPFVIWINGS